MVAATRCHSPQRLINLGPENAPDKRFSRRAENEGPADGVKVVQRAQQRKVMLSTLAEADAGTDEWVLGRIPPRLPCSERLLQKGEYIIDERRIGQVELHGPGHTLHVH
jgi:hypothetical protein